VKQRRSPEAIEALVVLIALAFAIAAATGGFFVGRATKSSTDKAIMTMALAGHVGGQNLPVSEIGNPARGAQIFVSKHCSDCHSYNGRGGEDAPPLDPMRGHLSAAEIAEMSGQIWNHLPAMLHHFTEEKITVPTFQGSQMADLIAYLHSGKGGPPPVHGDMKPGMNMTGTTSMSGGMMNSTPTK
jgi:mono/diheme cytochrome c family protein